MARHSLLACSIFSLSLTARAPAVVRVQTASAPAKVRQLLAFRRGLAGGLTVVLPVLLLSFVAFLIADPAAAQTGPGAHYRVSVTAADEFLVEARLGAPATQLMQRTPRSADRPMSAAASVRDAVGYTANGDAVDLSYAPGEGWRAPGGVEVVSLRYRLIADHNLALWEMGIEEVGTRFDDTYLFIGGVFFLMAEDDAAGPATIAFDLPADWVVTSPWRSVGRTHQVDRLISVWANAFAMGRNPPERLNVGDISLTWLTSTDMAPLKGRLAELLSVVPAGFAEFYGGAQTQNYTVFLFSDTRTDGGAYGDSLSIRVAAPVTGLERRVVDQLISHEVGHLWLGARGVRGQAPNQLAWFTEGFTDYLTVRVMHERGLIDDELRNQRLANFVRRALLGRRQSPDLSLAQAGERRGANYAWVYGGGALVALLLDAELSGPDKDGFRDMMRDLYAHSGEAFTYESLVERMNATTDGRAGEVIAWVESGPGIPEVRARLAAAGIEMAGFVEDEIYIRVDR